MGQSEISPGGAQTIEAVIGRTSSAADDSAMAELMVGDGRSRVQAVVGKQLGRRHVGDPLCRFVNECDRIDAGDHTLTAVAMRPIAADVLYAIVSDELYRVLVIERHWSIDAWNAWAYDSATIRLFPTKGSSR